MSGYKSKAEERRHGRRRGKLLDPVACGLERDVQIMQARRQVVEAVQEWREVVGGIPFHGLDAEPSRNKLDAACAALAKAEADK